MADPTGPPDDVYEAVARAQAERSGFHSAKNIERLTAQIAAGADFRGAVDSAYAAGVAAGRAQAAADIRQWAEDEIRLQSSWVWYTLGEKMLTDVADRIARRLEGGDPR